MSYSLESIISGDCLKIRITGAWPHECPDRILAEIKQLWENDQHPLLLDIRELIDDPTVIQDYELAKLMSEQKFWDIGPIAFLDTTERTSANHFLETTANNRALQIKFFYTEEQAAVNWLLQSN